jgi:hypothetical protein
MKRLAITFAIILAATALVWGVVIFNQTRGLGLLVNLAAADMQVHQSIATLQLLVARDGRVDEFTEQNTYEAPKLFARYLAQPLPPGADAGALLRRFVANYRDAIALARRDTSESAAQSIAWADEMERRLLATFPDAYKPTPAQHEEVPHL